jgi:hypothetical protein
VTTGVYLHQLGYTLGVQICGCIASLVAVTLVAVILDLFGKSMFYVILVSLGVSICLDCVSIETLDLNTGREQVSTVEKILTLTKS